jgi:hypothetical protein
MFKRLNTGGAILSPQEIRNCSARMLGEEGTRFYSYLQTLSGNPDFQKTTGTLAQADLDQKGNEELVLRFFAAKNSRDTFRGSVRDWLDEYMEAVLLHKSPFKYEIEKQQFNATFRAIGDTLGDTVFVKFRGKDDRRQLH